MSTGLKKTILVLALLLAIAGLVDNVFSQVGEKPGAIETSWLFYPIAYFGILIIIGAIIPTKGRQGLPFINYFKDISIRSEGIDKYKKCIEKLTDALKITPSIKKELDNIIENYQLKKEDTIGIVKKTFKVIYNRMTEDQIITEEERKNIEEIVQYFGIGLEELGFKQSEFNKYYMLGQLAEDKLPQFSNENISIVMKKNEVMHWAQEASIVKERRVTERINYGGPRASIKIAKGISYRVGSYKIDTRSRIIPEIVDSGYFWITNQRVGYIGSKKSFTCDINKILSLQLDDSLNIFKDGKQNPYQVWMADYEIAMVLLSKLINLGKEN
ncbi:MAG: hypothetical protein JW737_00250 [Acidobacteria bacterium]|nr:hypothetical protein [Acidobacteriota bacterium]